MSDVLAQMPDLRNAGLVVGPETIGQRLDVLLARAQPELSRARLQQHIREGHVTIGGAPCRAPSRRMASGEEIAWTELPAPVPAKPQAAPIPLVVLHEDADIIVIDKPAGLVVHPAPGHAGDTLVNALIAHCGESLSGIGGEARPGIVHRLDKDTSGVMIAAKHDAAHLALSRQFAAHGRDGALERGYDALVWGVPAMPAGVIDAPLARHSGDRLRMAVRSGGRVAITHYAVVQRLRAGGDVVVAARLELQLETGRTHQIRVHLAHIGNPVIADPLYARGFATKVRTLPEPAVLAIAALGRQALHAGRLGFLHPKTQRRMRFAVSPPEDWERTCATLL